LKRHDEEDKGKALRRFGAYITIPFVLAVPPVIGWFIGSWLDKMLGTEPYIMYTGLLLGFASGFLEFYKIIKKFGNDA
jgi:ATP synthase protein I